MCLLPVVLIGLNMILEKSPDLPRHQKEIYEGEEEEYVLRGSLCKKRWQLLFCHQMPLRISANITRAGMPDPKMPDIAVYLIHQKREGLLAECGSVMHQNRPLLAATEVLISRKGATVVVETDPLTRAAADQEIPRMRVT